MRYRGPSAEIKKFYIDYPFPNLNIKKKNDLKENGLYKLIYPLTKDYLKKEKLKILNAGCGTGGLMLGIERKGLEIDGIDLSQSSIEIAKKRANKFKSKIRFKVFDFVKDSLPKKRYDLVYSIGVYNLFGEFRFKIKRGIVHLLAGRDISKRVQIGQKLFYRRDYKLSPEEWTGIADAYANSYRRYYIFNQLLKWFKDSNFDFINCLPPIGIIQNLRYIYEIIKSLLQNGKLDLINSYNRMLEKNIQPYKWELNPVLTLLVQISWLLIGRGTLINIVGKRIK